MLKEFIWEYVDSFVAESFKKKIVIIVRAAVKEYEDRINKAIDEAPLNGKLSRLEIEQKRYWEEYYGKLD